MKQIAIRRWATSKMARAAGIYAAVSLVILLPLLGRGYILTLDMVFTPKLRMPINVNSSYLFYTLLHVLNAVLPSDVIEKIMLLLILWLAGFGLHRLVIYLANKNMDVYQRTGAYVGGLLYTINPFVYDRFMAGQYDVLLGYTLLPWFAQSLLRFFRAPAWRQTVVLATWAVVISIVSIHTIGLMAVLVIILFGLHIWHYRRQRQHIYKLLRWGLVALVITIIASSYWLVPLVRGNSTTATQIASFTATDRDAFATTGTGIIGKIGNVLRLQGFWAEGQALYTLPQAHIPAWGLLALMIWVLVIIGGISWWHDRQRLAVLLFGSSAGVALILAIGTFNNYLAVHVPFFAGYREPEKFVALLALTYALCTARGAASVLKYCHEQGGRYFLLLASVLLLLLPIVWTPTMLRGFNQQLVPVQYPAGWFAMNKRLDADPGNFQTLFLPWHLYMSFNFAGRIIATPAQQFFDKSMIVSNNPQFRGIAPGVTNNEETNIGTILRTAPHGENLGARLNQYHIKYVLLALDDDYATYGYLNRQTDLQLVAKNATLELYRNEAYRE
jgi:hypothetical protein